MRGGIAKSNHARSMASGVVLGAKVVEKFILQQALWQGGDMQLSGFILEQSTGFFVCPYGYKNYGIL